jgi:hypothetical protein
MEQEEFEYGVFANIGAFVMSLSEMYWNFCFMIN